MKKIKKLVAIALAAVMVFALGSVAFADMANSDGTTSAQDTGTITINGLEEGVTASAYKIAEATYDNDGNFLGYTMVSSCNGCTFQINSDGSYDEDALTEANLAELWSMVSSSTASGSATVSYGSNSATISDLGVGSYLIVITGSESVSYGMMIGSVSYTTEEGDWAIDNGTINVEGSILWAKATTPTVTKTENGGSADGDTHGESANAGDEITFDITVNNIPSYQGEYPVFDVDDTLTGLTISEDELNSLTVKIMNGEETVATLVKDTDYTVTPVGNAPYAEFDVNFVVDGKYMLNNYAVEGYTIVIEYQATVVDSEAYENGEAEHDNDAVLHYATTSYVNHDNNENTGTDEDKDYEYTFTLNAGKTDAEEAPLAGATFALYTDSACDTAYTQDDKAVTAVSDENGNISFSGLETGTYYMKETEAPAGYLLNQAVYTVVISAEYGEDGKITTWSIVITDEDGNQVASATSSADTGLTIINTKTGLLPSTGGRGTLIFTIIGCAIVVCAVVGVVATRRRRAA